MQNRDSKAFKQGVQAGLADSESGQPCFNHDPVSFSSAYILGYNMGWNREVQLITKIQLTTEPIKKD